MRPLPNDERVLELLGEIVSGDGGEGARSELRGLVGVREAEALIEEFELGAAAGEMALMDGVEQMPASARARVDAAAAALIASRAGEDADAQIPFATGGRGAPMALAVAGWLAAAACLALAAVAWMNSVSANVPQTPVAGPSVAERRAELLESAGDVISAAWLGIGDVAPIGAPDHPLDHGVAGDVVWSDERDEGYMRISGVEANDPGEYQYQLWIFDADRPVGQLPRFAVAGLPDLLTQRPVDGGVFDIAVGEDGEAIVPIDAKLPIGAGTIFAVTKEPPGGVVVSDREIVFLAVRG